MTPQHLRWRGTDFNSCQVSAVKMCVASQSLPCSWVLGSDLISKPPLPPLDTLANTQAPSDGKGRGKPLYQVQQAHRNVRPTQETYTELLPTTRFLFPPPPPPQLATTMVPPQAQLHTFTVTLICRFEHMNRKVYLNAGVFPLPLRLICRDEWLTRLWQSVCILTTWTENRQEIDTRTVSFHCIGKVSLPSRVGGRGLSPERTKSILHSYATRSNNFHCGVTIH